MVSSLRTRLLLSYVGSIGLTLCIVSVALILLLLRNPAPTRDAYRRLGNIARESLPRLSFNIEQINDTLDRIAKSENIRTLRLGPDRIVQFDSAEQLQSGQKIDFRNVQTNHENNQYGVYRDGGHDWLYVAYNTKNSRYDVGLIVFATR